MEIYCAQLGMMIDISYCLSVNEGLPCGNVIGCWQERVDVMAILKAKFNEEQLKKALGNLPKSKLERILTAIKSARREE